MFNGGELIVVFVGVVYVWDGKIGDAYDDGVVAGEFGLEFVVECGLGGVVSVVWVCDGDYDGVR